MAKLSAHGREVLRIEREKDVPADSLCTWERITRAYMADGKILEKFDVRFKPDQMDPGGRFHSYGWKIYGKLKDGFAMDAHCAGVLRNLAAKPETKWRILTPSASYARLLTLPIPPKPAEKTITGDLFASASAPPVPKLPAPDYRMGEDRRAELRKQYAGWPA